MSCRANTVTSQVDFYIQMSSSLEVLGSMVMINGSFQPSYVVDLALNQSRQTLETHIYIRFGTICAFTCFRKRIGDTSATVTYKGRLYWGDITH